MWPFSCCHRASKAKPYGQICRSPLETATIQSAAQTWLWAKIKFIRLVSQRIILFIIRKFADYPVFPQENEVKSSNPAVIPERFATWLLEKCVNPMAFVLALLGSNEDLRLLLVWVSLTWWCEFWKRFLLVYINFRNRWSSSDCSDYSKWKRGVHLQSNLRELQKSTVHRVGGIVQARGESFFLKILVYYGKHEVILQVHQVFSHSALYPYYVTTSVNKISNPVSVNSSWTSGLLFNVTVFVRPGTVTRQLVWDQFFKLVRNTHNVIGSTGLIITDYQPEPESIENWHIKCTCLGAEILLLQTWSGEPWCHVEKTSVTLISVNSVWLTVLAAAFLDQLEKTNCHLVLVR